MRIPPYRMSLAVSEVHDLLVPGGLLHARLQVLTARRSLSGLKWLYLSVMASVPCPMSSLTV